MRTVRLTLWILFSVFIIALAVLNRHTVDVWLLPGSTLPLPLFLVFFAGIFVGLIAAALVTGWLRLKSFTSKRQAERSERRTLGELDTVKNQLAEERQRHMSDDLSEYDIEKSNALTDGDGQTKP